jgi:hypothetical protein
MVGRSGVDQAVTPFQAMSNELVGLVPLVELSTVPSSVYSHATVNV